MKNTKNAALADTRRLAANTTPENLEGSYSTVLTFGDKVLIAGYYYRPDHKNYYGAIYTFTTADHTCEGKVQLVTTSEETFEDNGHAIAWCIANCNA